MRIFFFTIILIALPYISFAQLSGDGSYGSPYKGVMNQDLTWTSDVYIGGDIQNPAYILTINPGVKVIFLIDTADLKIRSTGRLIADGTSGSKILFTADDDNDGNYGESGERWGHISFESMGSAGVSTIDNCIIEYGDVSSTSLLPANPNQYGGAIHTAFSNMTISNCEIRNCKAGWGGGVFVGNGKNPAIANCYVHDNTSTTSGGGMYFWTNSYSSVTNCIVTYNSSTGSGGGGGIFLGGQTKNVYIINSIISHNSAPSQSYGHNIRFNNNTATPKPKFINSIVWYPANSIVYLSGGSALAADFEYCAIQTPPITYTNCITLNASNTDPAGPNFIDPDLPGLDWSITFVSPCRDAGTTSSATTDYLGNGRVWNYDIGAYEYQYSRWKTTASSADWNTAANWDGGIPTSSRDVVIPTGATNYPTGSTSQDFTLGSGKQMIIEQGARVTLDDLTNNGILKLNHNSSGFASLILGSYTRGVSGTEEIQLYLTGGGSEVLEDYKWHYISTPVSSLSTNVFTGVTLDLAQFVESRPSTSLLQGWVAYDGYVYSTGLSNGPTFSTLTPGKGYDFWDGVDNTFTFGGLFNTSNVAMSLSYSGVPATMHGFNLLGNPFSSGLNWDDIANSVYYTYPSNTSKGLYFTRNNLQCTYINGVGTPSGVTGIIPPMQGFFNKTYASGNSITLPTAARTHNNIHARYKGKTEIPLVRLSITEDTSCNDETVVRFDEEAKSYLDNDFDAVKMFLSSTKTTIHTSVDGTDYAINGLPFPETIVEIPVVVNMTSVGNHKITAIQLQGLELYNVTLTDNATGFIADLKSTPDLLFSSASGLIADRFILKINNIATDIKTPVETSGSFNIYHGYGLINIQTTSDEWDGKSGSVRILDMAGKTVIDTRNTEFRKNMLTRIQSPSAKGLYLVEIQSGLMRYVGKVIVK